MSEETKKIRMLSLSVVLVLFQQKVIKEDKSGKVISLQKSYKNVERSNSLSTNMYLFLDNTTKYFDKICDNGWLLIAYKE